MFFFSLEQTFFFAPNRKQTFFPSGNERNTQIPPHIAPFSCHFSEQTFFVFYSLQNKLFFLVLFCWTIFFIQKKPNNIAPSHVSSGRPLDLGLKMPVTARQTKGFQLWRHPLPMHRTSAYKARQSYKMVRFQNAQSPCPVCYYASPFVFICNGML